MTLKAQTSLFNAELVLTTPSGRVLLNPDDAQAAIAGILDYLGVDDVMYTVNDWCHRNRLSPWERVA